MSIRRFVCFYDLQSELLFNRQEVSHLNLNTLKSFFRYEGDEQLFNCYEIINDSNLCNYLRDNGIDFDFKNYSYFLEAEQAE